MASYGIVVLASGVWLTTVSSTRILAYLVSVGFVLDPLREQVQQDSCNVVHNILHIYILMFAQ